MNSNRRNLGSRLLQQYRYCIDGVAIIRLIIIRRKTKISRETGRCPGMQSIPYVVRAYEVRVSNKQTVTGYVASLDLDFDPKTYI